MWPFDRLRQRRYERRYKAAMVVLLGTYMIDRLSPDQRTQVESKVDANLNRSDLPAAVWRKLVGRSDFMSAFRAAAMEKVGIEPPVAGLSWRELFKPWANVRKMPTWPIVPGFDGLPSYLVFDFRSMHQATADAREYLRQHGMDIPDHDPWDSDPRELAGVPQQSREHGGAA